MTLDVKEFIRQRDAWILSQAETLRYETIAKECNLSTSRVKHIITKQRQIQRGQTA